MPLGTKLPTHRAKDDSDEQRPFKKMGKPEITRKDGGASSIRSRLKNWQEEYVRSTSPTYADQVLEHNMSEIWRQSQDYGVERGDRIAANDTGPAKAQDQDLDDDEEDTGDQLQTPEEALDRWQDAEILRPGDLIALESFPFKDPAIVVQCLGPDTVVYCLSGKWKRISRLRPKHLYFRESNFVERNLIEPIIPFIPPDDDSGGPMKFLEGAIPRTVGSPLLERLQAHMEEVQAFYMANTEILDHLWELLADENQECLLSLDDIAIKVFGKPSSDLTAPAIHALTHALISDYLNIYPKAAGRSKGKIFSLRSKVDSEKLQRVFRWVREYQDSAAIASHGQPVDVNLKENPLHQFIAKVRQAVLKNRSLRSPTVMGSVGPSPALGTDLTKIKIENGVHFSDTDKDIIRFMVAHYGPDPSRSTLIKSNTAVILRAIGAYPKMSLRGNTGRLFLKEIGYFAPWEFYKLHDPIAGIPGNGSVPSLDAKLGKVRALDANDPKQCSHDLNPGPRKDWKELAAFRVDSASTRDHDDAFSLEKAADTDDAWWIHAHIADPTAFISPDHPFVEYASAARSSIYLTDRRTSMFPPNFTRRLAIKPSQSVLTFSSLIKSDGAILKTEITSGIIRNVIPCTPKSLSRFLFGERSAPFCLDIRSSSTDTKIHEPDEHKKLEPHRETLEKLAELAQAMQLRRNSQWRPLRVDGGRYELNVSTSLLPFLKVNGEPSYSRTFQGDPSIRIEMNPLANPEFDVDVVGEIMINANITAATWCKNRGIPIPYMKTDYHPDFPPERLRLMDESEYSRPPVTRKSADPAPHDSVVADQYTQATSPLRRFHDMIVHWQIRGALLHDSKYGKQQNNEESLQASLPFSKSDIEKSIAEFEYNEKLSTRINYRDKTHWTLQALFRAIHFKEGQMPEVTYMRVTERKFMNAVQEDGWTGILIPFNVPAIITKSPENYESGVALQDLIACRISKVEVDAQLCHVVAIGSPLVPAAFNGISAKNSLAFTHEEYRRLLPEYEKPHVQAIQG
ncbi:MAG: hypothetical protein Q9160_005148 [Pyrenula sp. 1 TL-2023]